jgi:hypothetical protein
MATHLKPPVDRAPAELHEFDPAEWMTPEESSWWPAYLRWRGARRLWSEEHPNGSLGDMVAMMRLEHTVRVEMKRAWPEPGQDHVSRRKKWTSGSAELPAGTVTFLLTDIEGSTRLWETEPEAMEVALSTKFVPNNHACSTARLASSSPLTPRWKPRWFRISGRWCRPARRAPPAPI